MPKVILYEDGSAMSQYPHVQKMYGALLRLLRDKYGGVLIYLAPSAAFGTHMFKVSDRERARFMTLFERGPSCWVWKGVMAVNGYGHFYADRKYRMAHRVSYHIFKGPIPDGLVIDHLCCNPRCINPSHLEAVTAAENNRRGGHRSGDRGAARRAIIGGV